MIRAVFFALWIISAVVLAATVIGLVIVEWELWRERREDDQ